MILPTLKPNITLKATSAGYTVHSGCRNKVTDAIKRAILFTTKASTFFRLAIIPDRSRPIVLVMPMK